MNNTVCRNFKYNEKANSILELINFNCEECEFDGHCVIETATINQIWTPDEAKAFYDGFMAGLNSRKE